LATMRAVRRRIRSVGNIAKITRAMQMVAASRMRQAQERDLESRPYAEKMQQVISDLAALPGGMAHPLLQVRPVKNIAIVYITPDRGLCGGLNSNLNRATGGFILEQKVPVSLVTVGRKGTEFMSSYGRTIIAEFTNLGDRPRLLDTLPISRIIIDGYSKGDLDMVYVSYARFFNTIVQKPALEQLLPVVPAKIPRGENVDYLYEPTREAVLSELLPRFVEVQVYHAILESIASEQSARMVAMKNATDNANDLIDDLTLAYNKARQEAITKELLDISGGVAALEQ
jgi:F-type H+-transporting ATPase subunit gamma